MTHTEAISTVLRSKGSQVYSVAPSTCVYDALEMMAEKEIGALVVMDGESLVGLISERDYARKVILQGRSSKDTAVADIMTADVITVAPEDSVEECMRIMTENRIRHLPVLNGDKVAGVISVGDLVKSIISAQADEIQHLHAYISGSYTS